MCIYAHVYVGRWLFGNVTVGTEVGACSKLLRTHEIIMYTGNYCLHRNLYLHREGVLARKFAPVGNYNGHRKLLFTQKLLLRMSVQTGKRS